MATLRQLVLRGPDRAYCTGNTYRVPACRPVTVSSVTEPLSIQ
jgi:hypothetical protein